MAEEATMERAKLSRREFLYYIWGGSMALSMAGSVGAVLWFAYPRFKEGEFGGLVPLALDKIPPPGSNPVERADVKLWLVNTDQGFLGIYKVCTHLGCLYKWVDVNNRFECPCHGSKFQADGTYIEGPAPRNLDRFVVIAVDADGNELARTDENGDPLPIPDGTVELKVDTGDRIKGHVHG